jgi:hypothetical protein
MENGQNRKPRSACRLGMSQVDRAGRAQTIRSGF